MREWLNARMRECENARIAEGLDFSVLRTPWF